MSALEICVSASCKFAPVFHMTSECAAGPGETPLYEKGPEYAPCWPWRHCDHNVGVSVNLSRTRCKRAPVWRSVQGVQCCHCERVKARSWL